MPRRITADAMSWITAAFCACVCESFPVTSVDRPQAPALISFVRLCLVCPCCAAHQHVRRNQHMAPRHLVFFPKACLVNSLSPAGVGVGVGGEPQLLSDANAAQTLCVCGRSPSNQLMGYLTLLSSPTALPRCSGTKR